MLIIQTGQIHTHEAATINVYGTATEGGSVVTVTSSTWPRKVYTNVRMLVMGEVTVEAAFELYDTGAVVIADNGTLTANGNTHIYASDAAGRLENWGTLHVNGNRLMISTFFNNYGYLYVRDNAQVSFAHHSLFGGEVYVSDSGHILLTGASHFSFLPSSWLACQGYMGCSDGSLTIDSSSVLLNELYLSQDCRCDVGATTELNGTIHLITVTDDASMQIYSSEETGTLIVGTVRVYESAQFLANRPITVKK